MLINKACELYIRDNTQDTQVKTKKGFTKQKATCEYCKSKHNVGLEMCDLKIDEADANSIEGATKITLQQIIDMQEQ